MNVEITNMCMVQNPQTGEVLAQHRTRSWRGYAFPGGHLEQGESLEEAVIREVREETGLTVENPRLCGVVHWNNARGQESTIIFYYRADAYSGTLRASSEEGENCWMTLEALRALPLSPHFDEQMSLFFEEGQHEHFYDYHREDGRAVVDAHRVY